MPAHNASTQLHHTTQSCIPLTEATSKPLGLVTHVHSFGDSLDTMNVPLYRTRSLLSLLVNVLHMFHPTPPISLLLDLQHARLLSKVDNKLPLEAARARSHEIFEPLLKKRLKLLPHRPTRPLRALEKLSTIAHTTVQYSVKRRSVVSLAMTIRISKTTGPREKPLEFAMGRIAPVDAAPPPHNIDFDPLTLACCARPQWKPPIRLAQLHACMAHVLKSILVRTVRMLPNQPGETCGRGPIKGAH